MGDSLEFHGGEITLEGGASGLIQPPTSARLKNDLSNTYMQFEDRLEKMMQ